MADEKRISAEEIKHLKTVKELLEKQFEIKTKLVKVEQAAKARRGEYISQLNKELDLLQQKADLVQGNLDKYQLEDAALEELLEKHHSILADVESTNAAQEEANAEMLKINLILKEGAGHFKEMNEQALQSLDTLIAIKAAALGISAEMMAMVGVTGEWRKGITGAFADATEKGGSFIEVLTEVGKQLKDEENLINILGSSFEKAQEALMGIAAASWSMAQSVDSARASVNLATGAFGAYDTMLNDLRVSHLAMGATAEQAGKAISELHSIVRAFSNMSKTAQKDMASFTLTMELMGVSTSTTAESLQVAMAVLGQSKEQALATQRELLGVAKALKEAPEFLVKGFAASASALAKHGDDMIKVFSRLSGAAKALQTDVQTLTGAFGTQMDTFEGAAMSSAKINQLLGGQYIDTMKLLHADEEERIRIVLKGIEDSGLRADLLGNKFGRMAFANAAGITDVAEANKILKQGLGGYDAMIAKSKATAMSQKEMQERAKQAIDVQRSLAAAMESFAIAMDPVVKGIKLAAEWLVSLNEKFGMWSSSLAIVVGILSAFVLKKMLMARAGALVTKGLGFETAAIEGLTVAKGLESKARDVNALSIQKEVASGAGGAVPVAGSSAGMMLKAKAAMVYGAALLFVATGFLAIAAAVWLLADAVKGMSPEKFMMTAKLAGGAAAGLLIFSVALIKVGVAAGLAAPELLALGAGVALVGLGLALPIAAMALLIGQLKDFAPLAAEGGEGFLLLSVGVFALAAAMIVMGSTAGISMLGFITLAAGLTLVSLVVNTMSDEISSLGKMFEGLGKFAEAGQVNFTGMVKGIRDVADAAEKIDGKKLIGFNYLADVTHKFAESAKVMAHPEAKAGATVARGTIRATTAAPAAPTAMPSPGGAAGAAEGRSVSVLSTESAKVLADEIVTSMKVSSSDWKFFFKIGDGSVSDYIRMHNAAAKQAGGKT